MGETWREYFCSFVCWWIGRHGVDAPHFGDQSCVFFLRVKLMSAFSEWWMGFGLYQGREFGEGIGGVIGELQCCGGLVEILGSAAVWREDWLVKIVCWWRRG